jgi:hypothetical protein
VSAKFARVLIERKASKRERERPERAITVVVIVLIVIRKSNGLVGGLQGLGKDLEDVLHVNGLNLGGQRDNPRLQQDLHQLHEVARIPGREREGGNASANHTTTILYDSAA